MDNDNILYGFTATVILDGATARKVYLPQHRHLAQAEVEALEQAWEIGLPVPELLTVVYDNNSEITEIVTSRVEGRTLDELNGFEFNLAMEKIRRWVKRALRWGMLLDEVELTSIKGNVRVDTKGKVWFIDLN